MAKKVRLHTSISEEHLKILHEQFGADLTIGEALEQVMLHMIKVYGLEDELQAMTEEEAQQIGRNRRWTNLAPCEAHGKVNAAAQHDGKVIGQVDKDTQV